MAIPYTYSFLETMASLIAPGAAISLGAGAGVAEEGISIDFVDEMSSMQIGADGEGTLNIHASKAATVRISLLKTSPVNSLLMALRNQQLAAPQTAGQNTLTITGIASGDKWMCEQGGFRKPPRVTYGKTAAMMEWEFNFIKVYPMLGNYDNI